MRHGQGAGVSCVMVKVRHGLQAIGKKGILKL